MGFTIGITGHTNGFGQFLKKACEQKGYEVLGFSASNGYNFPEDVDKIFDKKLDIIINNTEFSTTQINIAKLAHERNVKCINIGSKITEAKVQQKYTSMKNNKQALKNLSKELGQVYLTWGFTKGHWILKDNPHLLENITIDDAVKEVINELGTS